MYVLIWSEGIPLGDVVIVGVYDTKAKANAAMQKNMIENDEEEERYTLINSNLNKEQLNIVHFTLA
jgi:hypothetical protein